MRVNKIRIFKVMGIDEKEITLENGITKITGPNGTGKTSLLEAVKAVMQPGYDATLVRNGAEKAEVVFVLDDGVIIKKTINAAGGGSLKVNDPKYGNISNPASYLSKIVDPLAINPVEFLNCPKKQRVDYLLQAMPLEVPHEKLANALNITGNPALSFGLDQDAHAFTVLATIKKHLFDQRTGVNRALQEKRGSIEQLSQSVPAEEPTTNWADQERAAEAALEEAKKTATASEAEITTKYTEEKQAIKDRFNNARQEAERAKNEAVKKLEAEFQAEKDRLDGDEKAALEDVNQRQGASAKKLWDEVKPQLEELTTKKTQAAERAKEEARHQNTRKILAQFREDAARLEKESEALTGKLDALEALKSEVMQNLPIPGLEIRDGEIFKDGVIWDRVNTQERVEVAIQLARLRSKELGVVCVDGLESLDGPHFAALEEKAKEYGLQLIVTRVQDPVETEA